MKNIKVTRYSVRPRAEIFVKGNRFLSFPKNMDKNYIYIYILYIYIYFIYIYIYIYTKMLRTKKKHNNRKNIKEAVTYICSKENLVENTLTNSPK